MSIKNVSLEHKHQLIHFLYIIYDFHALAKLSGTPRLLSYKAFYRKHLLIYE